MRRSSGKIDGQLFLDLIIFNNDCLKNQSLNDLSMVLEERHKIQITKQSLHERFNKYALAFLQRAMELLLEKQFNIDCLVNELEGIKRVLIKDSVCFQIDKSLCDIYPGSKGSNSGACVRIQFEFDLLNGRINDLSLNAFTHQDAKDSIETIEKTQEGDLIIRDLAYMEIKVLKALIQRNSFFICRLNPKVVVYTKRETQDDYQMVDFSKIAKHMRRENIPVMEKTVYIGVKEKLKMRLIIHLLPNDAIEKRIRKLKDKRSKKGKKATSPSKSIDRIPLNLLLTNTEIEQVSTKKVWDFYRLRWQIELVFKIWKSFCSIDKVKKVQIYRLQCYIYAKLILILLGWKVIWNVAFLMDNHGKELSFLKAFKTLMGTKFEKLRTIFSQKESSTKNFIRNFFYISIRKHLLEKKKGTRTSKQMLKEAIKKQNNSEVRLYTNLLAQIDKAEAKIA